MKLTLIICNTIVFIVSCIVTFNIITDIREDNKYFTKENELLEEKCFSNGGTNFNFKTLICK